MYKKPDVTAKTRQSMIDAFWELSIEQGLTDITVSQIAETAQVNRRTFYNHFINIDALQEAAENQFLDEYMNMIHLQILPRLPMSLAEFSDLTVNIFPIYSDKMYYLLGKAHSIGFENKIREKMSPFLASFVNIDPATPHFHYLQNYIISVLRSVFVTWYEDGQVLPVSELVPMIHRMVVLGLSGYKKQEIEL